MPLKLIPPREGKTKNWSIRGTYLGVYVDKTSRTDRRQDAGKRLAEIEAAIRTGQYEKKPDLGSVEKSFARAALAYMESGGQARYVAPLIKYFGEMPVSDINQELIDDAALAVCPRVTPATRNRVFYTPLAAILHRGNSDLKIRRPAGAKGQVITRYLSREEAGAIIAAAATFDPEYALLLRFLLYTGVRLGEALRLEWRDVRLAENAADIRLTKNGDPRPLVLRDDLCAALKIHAQTTNRERVFRFSQGGWLKWQLLRAKLTALGLPIPARPRKGQRREKTPHALAWVNHHTFRHTWATWMRRYGGTDQIGLMATGNWRDPRSAARYAHAVARDEWSRVDRLPAVGGKSGELKVKA